MGGWLPRSSTRSPLRHPGCGTGLSKPGLAASGSSVAIPGLLASTLSPAASRCAVLQTLLGFCRAFMGPQVGWQWDTQALVMLKSEKPRVDEARRQCT